MRKIERVRKANKDKHRKWCEEKGLDYELVMESFVRPWRWQSWKLEALLDHLHEYFGLVMR